MSATDPTDSTGTLTAGGQRFAEHYAHALALMDRLARSVEEGNWPFAADVAGEASTALDELSTAASVLTTEATATVPAAVLDITDRLARPEG
ncbi:hypothetical protein [Streptacidiphilus sp. EB129]|uniref:hypothetical protein n=1 Tax=Streptacidiphilus sp. EB129 TaxID=3156262 RepID=UPI003512811C